MLARASSTKQDRECMKFDSPQEWDEAIAAQYEYEITWIRHRPLGGNEPRRRRHSRITYKLS